MALIITKKVMYPSPAYGSPVAKPPTDSNSISVGVSVCICIVVILVIVLTVIGVAIGVGVALSRKNDGSSIISGGGSQYTDEGSDTGNFPVLSAPTVNCIYSGSSSCGCSATKPSFLAPRIVNGYTAVANSWPWIVAIYITVGNTQAFCGGFLVTYRHVITAAHCVDDVTANAIKVYAGIQKLTDRDSGQSRGVSTINVHPSYGSTSAHNDIAVLTLQSAFSETSTVGKCCLTFNTSLPSVGEHAVIIGWGKTSFNSARQPNNLLQGVIQIQNRTTCFATERYSFCAAYRGTDICFGDSGGPLMTSVNNAWTCTGVVSAGLIVNGSACGTVAVYTRVSAYQSFISGIISG